MKDEIKEIKDEITDSQKLDKLLVLIDLLNMEIKGIRKLIMWFIINLGCFFIISRNPNFLYVFIKVALGLFLFFLQID